MISGMIMTATIPLLKAVVGGNLAPKMVFP